MSEVPKHWQEFKSEVKGWEDVVNATVDKEDQRRREEYKTIPWYKKLFKHSPGDMGWELSLVSYGIANWPKYTKGTIEEYYDWLIERGKES